MNVIWNLQEGIVTTALGMTVVFVVLTLLIMTLEISGRFFASREGASEAER